MAGGRGGAGSGCRHGRFGRGRWPGNREGPRPPPPQHLPSRGEGGALGRGARAGCGPREAGRRDEPRTLGFERGPRRGTADLRAPPGARSRRRPRGPLPPEQRQGNRPRRPAGVGWQTPLAPVTAIDQPCCRRLTPPSPGRSSYTLHADAGRLLGCAAAVLVTRSTCSNCCSRAFSSSPSTCAASGNAVQRARRSASKAWLGIVLVLLVGLPALAGWLLSPELARQILSPQLRPAAAGGGRPAAGASRGDRVAAASARPLAGHLRLGPTTCRHPSARHRVLLDNGRRLGQHPDRRVVGALLRWKHLFIGTGSCS